MINLNQNLALALTILCLYMAPALAEGEAKTREDEININDYRILNTADPGLAQDEATAKAPKERAKISLKPSQTKAPQHKTGRNLLTAPMAVGGVLMGMTVGVPVRIARDISHETLRMRDQMTDDVSGGDKPDLFARTVGSYSGMAYGVVSGVIKGSIKGTERAIDCGARKPFSKESLSLQDPN
ncbi:MAG: hypothetical protein C0508_26915 [Cyanobacteria bacterium PR.023]|nr:hypothetical protein [Cyanobacteria bacterium PR.023]